MINANHMRHVPRGAAIEKININGMHLALLAAGDGTEIIHHRLSRGATWALGPEAGWEALEFVFIISGALVWQRADGKFKLFAGDTISAVPVKMDEFFIAEENTEFLYVTSRPVFHHYSGIISEMMELSVQVAEKDGYTADHCLRIKNYSMIVGEKLGLSANQLYDLNLGAFLHDIGKVRVPEHILNKPAALSIDEWVIMKKHTIYGNQMLKETNYPALMNAGVIVEQHHERHDGSGYPFGLRGDDIHIGAAIVAVVDSFDAMTTDRVYKKGRSVDEALSEIQNCSGSHYNPEIVDTFISLESQIVR